MGLLQKGIKSGKKPSGLGAKAQHRGATDIPILQSNIRMEHFNENLELSKKGKLTDAQFCFQSKARAQHFIEALRLSCICWVVVTTGKVVKK